jgi:MFS family permease
MQLLPTLKSSLIHCVIQIGPIVGGWIAQTIESWRWTFYVCAIVTAVMIAVGTVTLPETYAPKLNRTKTVPFPQMLRSLGRPFVLLGTQPIIQVLAIYAAIIFGTYYLFLTTVVSVFRDDYGQPVGIASLHYLALLLGFLTSVVASGKAMDALYRRLSKDNPSPEARIPYLGASGTLLPAGLLIYGWATRYTIFWLVPDIGLFFIGLGMFAPLAAIQHYILDCYSSNGFAASALAAMNVARFLAGFGFPLFADKLYGSLGLGWGNSLLALIAAVVGCFSISLWKFGPRLREMSTLTETTAATT